MWVHLLSSKRFSFSILCEIPCKQQILSVLLILKVYFTSILKDNIFEDFWLLFYCCCCLLLLLFLWTLWICYPLLLASIIYPEKSTVNRIWILFEVKSPFPITSFRIFSLFGTFSIFTMIWLWISLYLCHLDFIKFLDV